MSPKDVCAACRKVCMLLTFRADCRSVCKLNLPTHGSIILILNAPSQDVSSISIEQEAGAGRRDVVMRRYGWDHDVWDVSRRCCGGSAHPAVTTVTICQRAGCWVLRVRVHACGGGGQHRTLRRIHVAGGNLATRRIGPDSSSCLCLCCLCMCVCGADWC